MKINKLCVRILYALLIAIMLYCIYRIGMYVLESMNTQMQNNEIQEIYRENKFDDLLNINKDIVGWISILDTDVDYPILQSHNNNYYLEHNFKKEPSKAGSIFMDFKNTLDDKNIILYGHHMKDKSMFFPITYYKDFSFYKNHQYAQLDTPNSSSHWQVFSAYVTDTTFNYIQTQFKDSEDFKDYLDEIKGLSLYDTDVLVDVNDDILTLSTCSYEYENARFVVHLKKK